MKRLKIAFLLISEGWAGAENSVFNTVKSLGNLVEVSLLINKEIMRYYRKLSNIKIYDFGPLFKGGRITRFLLSYRARKKLFRILKRSNFDLISLYLGGSQIMYYNMYNKINTFAITSLRGGEIKNFFRRGGTIQEVIDRLCLKKALEKSSAITSLSSWQIQNLPEKYKKKTVVIPNGVDSKVFKPLKNIKQRKNIILFTGRFIDIKGIREILVVAKQLPQYEFWFVGQGPLSDEIKGKNVKNLGFKSTEELVKLYNQATICILPSHREAFGNVGLEAMSCGKGVIVTPLGFSEYVENGKDGIIIPSKNEKALKEAILKLMKNKKLRKKLGENARKKALRYSWDKVAKKYLKVFKEVIKNAKKK